MSDSSVLASKYLNFCEDVFVLWILTSLSNPQAMLTGEPAIVEGAASLLKAVVTRNPKGMSRLYSTGAFYFALAYGGSNLKSVASLFATSHTHQAFHGGAEAAVSSSLPLAKQSVLGGLLPESLLYVLERSGPTSFATGMVADSDTPEIIWTHKMRGECLIDQVRLNFLFVVESMCTSVLCEGFLDSIVSLRKSLVTRCLP